MNKLKGFDNGQLSTLKYVYLHTILQSKNLAVELMYKIFIEVPTNQFLTVLHQIWDALQFDSTFSTPFLVKPRLCPL